MICTTVQRTASYDTSHSSPAAEKRNSNSLNSPHAVESGPSPYVQMEHLPFMLLSSVLLHCAKPILPLMVSQCVPVVFSIFENEKEENAQGLSH